MISFEIRNSALLSSLCELNILRVRPLAASNGFDLVQCVSYMQNICRPRQKDFTGPRLRGPFFLKLWNSPLFSFHLTDWVARACLQRPTAAKQSYGQTDRPSRPGFKGACHACRGGVVLRSRSQGSGAVIVVWPGPLPPVPVLTTAAPVRPPGAGQSQPAEDRRRAS